MSPVCGCKCEQRLQKLREIDGSSAEARKIPRTKLLAHA